MSTSSVKIAALAGEVDGAYWVQLSAIQRAQSTLVGSATILDADSDTPTLSDLYVHVGYRRQGIARLLVRNAKRWAALLGKSLYLHVRPDNPARHLYEQEQFAYTGEVKEGGAWWMIKLAAEDRFVQEVPDG